MEVISTDRNADTRRDLEWTHQTIERVGVHDAGDVGVDQLGLKQADDLARVEPVLIVGHVVDACLRGELPHIRYPHRPRAEPRLHEVAPHVGSSQEPNLREEVRFDHEPLRGEPVAIAGVIEEPAVT
jgi:hypothetical protein